MFGMSLVAQCLFYLMNLFSKTTGCTGVQRWGQGTRDE